MRRLILKINLNKLLNNFKQVELHHPSKKIWVIIKANAYGFGAIKTAQYLSQQKLKSLQGFGVCCLEEALELRENGIADKVLLLEGFFESSELPIISKFQLDCVIVNEYQIEILKKQKLTRPINIWLKINTGMNRLGLSCTQTPHAIKTLLDLENVKSVQLMSHFHSADKDIQASQNQIDQFEVIHQKFNHLKTSFSNSAAIMNSQLTIQEDFVRPGLLLYGANPMSKKIKARFELETVGELVASIIDLKTVALNESIGYGHTWQAKQSSLIAIVNCGYADGYLQHFPNSTPAYIKGQKISLVGRVSMDMIAFDVSAIKQPLKIGDEVCLWGNQPKIEEFASLGNTISYNLFTALGNRVYRQYLND